MYSELSGIVYDTMFLALTVSEAWAPEFANLDLRLPGTTNIRVCEINFAVDISNVTDNPLPAVAQGTARVILGVIKQLNRMPNLETIHVWYSGVVYALQSKLFYRTSLDQELRYFLLLKDYEETTKYKVPYHGPVNHPWGCLLLQISEDLHNNDSTRFGRAFTCHVKRP